MELNYGCWVFLQSQEKSMITKGHKKNSLKCCETGLISSERCGAELKQKLSVCVPAPGSLSRAGTGHWARASAQHCPELQLLDIPALPKHLQGNKSVFFHLWSQENCCYPDTGESTCAVNSVTEHLWHQHCPGRGRKGHSPIPSSSPRLLSSFLTETWRALHNSQGISPAAGQRLGEVLGTRAEDLQDTNLM